MDTVGLRLYSASCSVLFNALSCRSRPNVLFSSLPRISECQFFKHRPYFHSLLQGCIVFGLCSICLHAALVDSDTTIVIGIPWGRQWMKYTLNIVCLFRPNTWGMSDGVVDIKPVRLTSSGIQQITVILFYSDPPQYPQHFLILSNHHVHCFHKFLQTNRLLPSWPMVTLSLSRHLP